MPLTWTGVREYPQIQIDGHAARVLRRPEQVFAPAHLRTLHRLPATHDHPRVKGANVRVTPDNYRNYQVGQTGDTLDRAEVEGYPVPTARATVVDRASTAAIRSGDTQTSLGYTAMMAPPDAAEVQADGSGLWQGPHGPEAYDIEHLLDPEDPRVLAYAEQDPDFSPADLGGNHLAVAIPRGRGGAQSELLSIVDAYDALGGASLVDWPETNETTMADQTNTPTKIVHCVDIAPPKGSSMPRFTCDMDPAAAAVVKDYLTKLLAELESALGAKAELEVKMGDAEAAAGNAAAAATAEKTDMEGKMAAMADELGAVKATCDALTAEVKPLREQAITKARETAVKLGAPRAEVDAAEDLPAIQALILSAVMGAPVVAPTTTPASPSPEFRAAAGQIADAAPISGRMSSILNKINGATGAEVN